MNSTTTTPPYIRGDSAQYHRRFLFLNTQFLFGSSATISLPKRISGHLAGTAATISCSFSSTVYSHYHSPVIRLKTFIDIPRPTPFRTCCYHWKAASPAPCYSIRGFYTCIYGVSLLYLILPGSSGLYISPGTAYTPAVHLLHLTAVPCTAYLCATLCRTLPSPFLSYLS